MYLSTEAQWAGALERIERERVIGLDTEFYGVDFKEGHSCVNRAQVHVWSVAVLTGKMHPRGYRTATGAVLPREALPFFKGMLEDPAITKVAHNSNVDVHALYNAGIDTQGIVNTLSLSRWTLPGRQRYGLDVLCQELLGAGKADHFNDIFRFQRTTVETRWKDVTHCDCGVSGCRKRRGHMKTKVSEPYDVEVKDGWGFIPLESVVPGHPLWERLVVYAEVDAVRALELHDRLIRSKQEIEIPYYSPEVTYDDQPS